MSHEPDKTKNFAAELAQLHVLFASPEAELTAIIPKWEAGLISAYERSDYAAMKILLGLIERATGTVPSALWVRYHYYNGLLNDFHQHDALALACYRTAQRFLEQGGPEYTLWNNRLNARIGRSLYYATEYDEAETLAQQVLNDEAEPSCQALAKLTLSLLAQWRGEHKMALSHALQAIDLYQQANDSIGQISANSLAGVYYINVGDMTKAIERFQIALQMCQTTGNQRRASQTLNNLAAAHEILGHYDEALANYQATLLICQTLQLTRSAALAMDNISGIYLTTKRYTQSLEYARQVLDTLNPQQEARLTISALNNAITACYHLGQRPQAREYAQRALQLASLKLDDPNRSSIVGTYESLADALTLLAATEADRLQINSFFQTTLDYYQQTNNIERLAEIYQKMAANTAAITGQSVLAAQYYDEAWHYTAQLPQIKQANRLFCILALAEAQTRYQNPETAQAAYQLAFDLIKTMPAAKRDWVNLLPYYLKASQSVSPDKAYEWLNGLLQMAQRDQPDPALIKSVQQQVASLKKKAHLR